MSKRNKIVIIILAAILILVGLIAGMFLRTFHGNLSLPKDFLVVLKATEESKEIYGSRKTTKAKKQNTSCLNLQIAQVKKTKSVVDSDGYKKMWGYIDETERAANWFKAIQAGYDIFGNVNPGAVREILPFFIGKYYEDIMALPKEADYAMIDAMCDKSLEWETKFWLSQILGDRNAIEALPLFREISMDEDEPFSLRVSSMDQIRKLRDRDSGSLMIGLLDNSDDIIRIKASSTLRDITDQGDEKIYETILSHYYNEQDETVKDCLLGSMIVIGGDGAIPQVREILKTATPDEKETIAILLKDVHSDGSVEILKDMYDAQDQQIGGLSSVVISSLAKSGSEEVNEFLYGIIDEANGILSVVAAGDLANQGRKGVIPHIEKALEKETNQSFIKDYQDFLDKLTQ